MNPRKPTDTLALQRRSTSMRTTWGVVLLTAVLSTGCGGQTASRSGDGSAGVPSPAISSQAADLEPATAPGLAAAVMAHLDDRHAKVLGGGQNKGEGWTAVDFEVGSHGRTVELRLFVASLDETTERTDPPKTGRCPTSHTVLYCRIEKAPDGSRLGLQASTEDIVGGAFDRGFSADVSNSRGPYAVLVSEILPNRKKAFVEMTRLPLPVEVLKAIATDPLVGPRTTPDFNRAGKRDYRRGLFDVPPE